MAPAGARRGAPACRALGEQRRCGGCRARCERVNSCGCAVSNFEGSEHRYRNPWGRPLEFSSTVTVAGETVELPSLGGFTTMDVLHLRFIYCSSCLFYSTVPIRGRFFFFCLSFSRVLIFFSN
ncbi:hypothetical protein SETIT_8G068700v2 [Setaria italica]|uniref:Uncharacterized protein n=1 Tax=Setaria italica TaxID=4555 RepID=A0A368S507_SETIT|nr:hypothetical protein SETIT_8G068700v2 [Setaria italica]